MGRAWRVAQLMLPNLRVFKLPVRLWRRIAKFGKNWQPIGRKWQDARPTLCDQRGRKETALTQIDSTLDPFVEVEIKEQNAALIGQMVAIGIIICVMLMLVGTASLIIDAAKSLVGLLTVAFERSIVS
jgi:hypothetical protein